MLKREGLGLVAVSYDPVAVLADFSTRRGITFPLLSDAGSAVIKQYGILNTTVAPASTNYGIPFPGTFFLDANGAVTSRHFETAYQERDTIMSVLVKRGAKVARLATKIEAAHLTLTTYLTDEVAAPGTHFSAVVEVTPGARIHVYAPGVAGYKPVAIDIHPQPGLVVRGAQYPAPEDYFFKPLDEHVAVYQRPFRIVQDFEIDPAPQAAEALKDRREMAIAGAFAYQACDDKVCFTPQAAPLTWTIGLRALDRERAAPRP
jgi:DsbC/DsbD-like thiol-disulfide interchange protein